MNTYRVQLKRIVSCTPQRAFQLWTDAELMAKWFCPPDSKLRLTTHPEEGGSYRFEIETPTGDVLGCSGAYVVVDPPGHLAFTWKWDESSFEPGVSEVDLRFVAVDGGTELVLTHTKLASEFSEGRHAQGWIPVLTRFEAFAANG